MLRKTLVKGVAAGIGLASESTTAYKARKRDKEAQEMEEKTLAEDEISARHEVTFETHEHQEEEWQLDEAQDQLAYKEINPASEVVSDGDMDRSTESFLRNYSNLPPTPEYYDSFDVANDAKLCPPKLPYPVVLPQRRPKSKKRGFIRAYAPVLEDFGIDQAMFLDFLETSNRSCQANPWLNAINLASIPTMFIPGAISIVASIMINLATDFAIAVDGRKRTNSFFDKVNEEIFRPRGLYCLVMTWKPESSSAFARFDMNSAISTNIDHGGEGALNKLKHKFKGSDGKTYGNLQFPETAPLIFPDLDVVATQSGGDKKAKLKNCSSFVEDYWDRRGQAKFAMENPDSALNDQTYKPEFTSRYADPSHPANSGSLIALVTGGHISKEQLSRRRGRRSRLDRDYYPGAQRHLHHTRREHQQHHHYHRGIHEGEREGETYPKAVDSPNRNPGTTNPRRKLGSGSLVGGGIKKLLSENVLYLMIVNMPSEEEMREARESLHS